MVDEYKPGGFTGATFPFSAMGHLKTNSATAASDLYVIDKLTVQCGMPGPEDMGQSCTDECFEERADGAKWCTANGVGSQTARAAECVNGTIVYNATINGIACGEATRYQCR